MSKQEKGLPKTGTAKFDQAELRKLWKQPTSSWVTLLSSLGAQKVKDAGDTIKLQCPYHADVNPSGILNISKGYYRCFSCNQFTKDPILFVNKYLGSTYLEVARTFRDHFKLEKLDLKKLDETELEHRRMKMLNEVFHRYLCSVWIADKVPANAAATVNWLKNHRGITSPEAHGSLGMLPTSSDLQKLCAQVGGTEEDIAWGTRLVGDYLNVSYMNCVVYTYATVNEDITAFKLRIPGPDKESVRFVRLHDTGDLGAYGIITSAFYKHYASDKVTRFIAVEGEHDAISLTQGMLQHCPDVDEVVIALGGNGHNGLDFMADLGFSECRLVGDDDAAGDSYPASVLSKTKRVSVQVFKWPQRIRNPVPGKIDPDEAVKVHGFEAVYKELCNERNYEYASRWCIERAKVRIKGIHPDNILSLQDVGTEFGGLLRNDTERQVFADEFARMCPALPANELLRKTNIQDDSALGFVEKLADYLRKEYQVTTWDGHRGLLKLWSKKRKQYLDILVDQNAAITLFKRYHNGSLYNFVKKEIGIPSYFPSVDDPEAAQTALNKAEDMITRDLQRAFSLLSAEATDDTGGFVKGQGIHLEYAEEGKPGYIVNGSKVYKLVWNKELSSIDKVTELDGPTDNGIVFDLEHRRNLIEDMTVGWTSLVTSAKDLTQIPPYTAQQTFKMVHRLINTGFGFRCQEVDSLYCAGLVFYNHLYDVIPNRRMLTHFYAQFESGKTTLLSVTTNHTQLREFSLCDHAMALDSFTQAGFYQIFNNTRLVSALDEMNDLNDNTPESRNKKMFYQRCRTLATAGKATLSQGTVEGQSRAYVIRNNVITASGTVIHDAMDESRFNTINLKKNPKHNNVRLVLRNTFTQDEIHKLRLSVLLHSINLAPRVRQRYQDLYTHFGSRAAQDGSINIQNVDRFTENLMPMAAILDVFGVDGKKFIEDYRDSRKQQVYERNRSTAGHSILDAILTKNIPSREEENQFTNIKAMLLMANDRHKINNTKVGVYYDDVSQCLGIMWAEVKQNLLRDSNYKTKTAFALKAEAETAGEWLIDRDEALKLGIVQRLMSNGMTSSSDVYSLVSVSALITKHQEAVNSVLASQRAQMESHKVVEVQQPFSLDEGDPLKGID